jgi:hypothetical protein
VSLLTKADLQATQLSRQKTAVPNQPERQFFHTANDHSSDHHPHLSDLTGVQSAIKRSDDT